MPLPRIFPGLLALVLAIPCASAHDPLDCSARLMAQVDRIEITVTLGVEGARQILAMGGLDAAGVAEAMRPRGPHNTIDLPPTLASHFFELKIGDERLAARKVVELSDGMEVVFIVVYPRPPSGSLNIRANCYDEIPNLRNGSLVAYDEQGNSLGAASLSRAAVNAHVDLPAPDNAASSGSTVPARGSGPALNTIGPAPNDFPSKPVKQSPRRLWFGVLPIAAASGWLAIRRSAKGKS